MKTVLWKARPADVRLEPFPHLVVRDAMDEGIYRHLCERFPPIDVFTGGAAPPSNRRFNLNAVDVLADERLDPLWREHVRLHTSSEFFHRVLDLFEDHIRRLNPGVEAGLGPLRELRVGLRHRDDYAAADLLLDATVVINTPVVGRPSSVRRGHVDKPHKLYSGLFYMRHPEDRAAGGDLELYRFRGGRPGGFHDREVPDRWLERVATVRYEPNVLVMYPNCVGALHGVTVREPGPYPRRLLTFASDLARAQFDLAPFQQRAESSHRRPSRGEATA